ncbi:MAG TPA: FecR domain-containing protein [Candidatus Limnocylindria bacterium]
MNGRLRVGVAGLGLAFVLAIVLGATGVLAPKSQRVALGASTTLTIIAGPIFVRHLTGDFVPADDGVVLGTGDTVKTGPDARAVLTYFEGSTVEIEPNSELTIDTANANPDGSTVIVMQQDLGTTWHSVTHLVNSGSKYEVHTTAATASVRGTAFTVDVGSDGTTTETTTEGAVANSDPQGGATVVTAPGLQTTTAKGAKPQAPVPAPQPDRTVTVTVGDQNALVVDTLGRANGIKDGKRIVQTPGAQLSIVDGHLVVTLPNLPDGVLSTHFLGTSGDTDVTTKVKDKGFDAVEVDENVRAGTNGSVDIRRGAGGDRPSVNRRSDENGVPSPKVGNVPLVPTETPAPNETNDHDTSGPAVTPPGQLLTPPGQLRTPPANPSAPGQLKTPPGQSQVPPGQGGSIPGNGDKSNGGSGGDANGSNGDFTGGAGGILQNVNPTPPPTKPPPAPTPRPSGRRP